MLEQPNNNVEKQTPFLKRIGNLEQTIKDLEKEIDGLKKEVKILIKVLRRG